MPRTRTADPLPLPLPLPLDDARRWIAAARRPMALSGAGLSAESGIATFRGPGGLWEKYDPTKLATPEAFRDDPRAVWAWYHARREAAARAQPNPGHRALARWQERTPSLVLITQNVDGLLQSAGARALELHGSLWRTRCTRCGDEEEERELPLPPLPECGACGGLLRPAVVWFGEPLDASVLDTATRAIEACDLVVSVGTSHTVQPAASMALAAKANGARFIEINPERTPAAERADAFLQGKAGEVLPLLLGVK